MSPVRARSPARSRSPIRRRSSRSLSPIRSGRRRPSWSLSPVRASRRRLSRSRSPIRRRSPYRRTSPVQLRTDTRTRSPSGTKARVHVKSPVGSRSPIQARSPVRSRSLKRAMSPRSPSRSPSPYSKFLRQTHEGREFNRVKDREYDRRNNEDHDRGRHKDKDKGSGRDGTREARGRDKYLDPSSMSRQSRSMSPRSPSRSPSPYSKFLRQTQEGREFNRVKDREYDRRNNEDHDRGRHKDRDKGSGRDGTREARGRDKYLDPSSMSRQSRSISPNNHRQRRKHGSRSPPRRSSERGPDKPNTANAGAYDEVPNQSAGEMLGSENPSHDSLAKMKAAEEALEVKQNDKVKPSFELSGKLAAETNKVRGIALLFNEPPDARKPTIRWRLYVFKGGEALTEPLYIHRQTCYLFGRERRVADIPTDHPSCSKQHAVIQFRQVEKEEPDGTVSKRVRPYLMDLGSTNGTHLNDNRLEPQRYYELFEKDTIKFGNSSREYVLLHENSAG